MTAAAVPRGWAGDLVRSAAGPVICAAVLIGLLSAWVASGGAGTISRIRIQVTLAAIPMRSFTAALPAAGGRRAGPPDAAAYLTIRNLSALPDELTGASSPASPRVILTRPAASGSGETVRGGTVPSGARSGTRLVVTGVIIPAHGAVTLSPFGDDVELTGFPRLIAGQHVPLTLTFRHAGRVTVEATVTAPGAP